MMDAEEQKDHKQNQSLAPVPTDKETSPGGRLIPILKDLLVFIPAISAPFTIIGLVKQSSYLFILVAAAVFLFSSLFICLDTALSRLDAPPENPAGKDDKKIYYRYEKLRPWAFIGAGLIFGFMFTIISLKPGRAFIGMAFAGTPTPTMTPTPVLPLECVACPTSVPTRTPTHTPSPAPTATPTPTFTPTPVPEWKTNLSDGDSVAHLETLIVEYTGQLQGDLWVFVVPAQSGRYYPQSSDSCQGRSIPEAGGKWEMRVWLGVPESTGDLYDIVLAVARTQLDNQFIAGKLITWCRNNFYPGFEQLPDELSEVHRIHKVVRTAGRWGAAPPISNAQIPGEVDIQSLTDNQVVSETTLITGTHRNTTGELWVLVHTVYGLWYPQSTLACAGIHTEFEGGQWQVPADFGGQPGDPFDVVVLLAGPEASQFFDSRQQEWCKAGHYFGLLTIELPQGIEEKERVRVYSR